MPLGVDLRHRAPAVPAKDAELAPDGREPRIVTGPPALPWHAALELERASRMWSMRRRAT